MNDDGSRRSTPDSVESAVRRHTIEWVVLSAAAIGALVLGAVGFGERGASAPDALYRSVQLFVLESGALPGSIPPALEIARWLAPAVAGYAAGRALFVLFRDEFQRVTMRLLLRDHVVVAGLGEKGYTLALALRGDHRRVVAIERDEANPAVAGCRRRDVPVVIGDATDPSLLARVRLDRASHLVVVTGDDRRNVEVAFAAKRPPDRTPLNVLVHLDDLGLWRLLQAEAVAKRARLRLRLDFFNVREAAARTMLEQQPPFAMDPREGEVREPHLLIVESDRLGESVLLRAAGLWQATARPGEELLVTLAGEGTESALALLLRSEPALGRICAVEALETAPASLGVTVESDAGRPDGRRRITAVYICVTSEAEGLAVALALHGRPDLAEVPIVVAVSDERAGISVAIRDEEMQQVQTFGVVGRTLTSALLERGTSEALARAKHEHYVECERIRGTPSDGNPSMLPWSQLDEALKESNRRFADSIGVKLEAAGCAIVPAPLADPADPGFAFGDDEVEELARDEHERWCRDLEADGWRFGRTKDPVAKRHPKLLPWDLLTKEDRDKDREPVALLPSMLARVGFQIQRGRASSIVTHIHRRQAGTAAGEEPPAHQTV